MNSKVVGLRSDLFTPKGVKRTRLETVLLFDFLSVIVLFFLYVYHVRHTGEERMSSGRRHPLPMHLVGSSEKVKSEGPRVICKYLTYLLPCQTAGVRGCTFRTWRVPGRPHTSTSYGSLMDSRNGVRVWNSRERTPEVSDRTPSSTILETVSSGVFRLLRT